jgi:hypothetical protein
VVTQGKASMNKHIEQIDRETGEVMQGCMVYIPYRPKMKERWFMAFQDTFEELAKDPELTLEPKNVLPDSQSRRRIRHNEHPIKCIVSAL